METSICYGRTDVALASTAAADVEAALVSIPAAAPRRLFSSPATRCRRLADAISMRDRVDICIDPRLMELDFGKWEGCSWESIPRLEIDEWNADLLGYRPGGGESFISLWDRVREFREQVLRSSGDAIIVSHHGPLRALAAQYEGLDPERLFDRTFAYGSCTCIEVHSSY